MTPPSIPGGDRTAGPKERVTWQSSARELLRGSWAKRPIAAILRYLTLVVEQILDAYPSGKLPPIDQITLRDPKELEPFLKVPSTPGWKFVFELPLIGPFTKG